MGEPDRGKGRAGGHGAEGRRLLAGSRSEWLAAAASLLLVAGAIGYLLLQALGSPTTPPRIHLQMDSIVAGGDGYLVELHARNAGSTAAAALQVEGVLLDGARVVESSQAVLDYVPGESATSGGLFFSADPRAHRLELRAMGYQRP